MAKNALPSRLEHRDDVAPLCTFSSLVHVLHALPNGARPVASRLRVVAISWRWAASASFDGLSPQPMMAGNSERHARYIFDMPYALNWKPYLDTSKLRTLS